VPIDDGFELIVRQADREFLGSPLRRQPETPFYHYTDAAGLSGILETHSIWATEYGKLNDPHELTRGERVIQDELEAISQEYPETTPRGWLCRHVEQARQGHRLIDIPNIGIYVASFSSHGDLLDQWRAYADDASGYTIGFNSLPLPTGVQAPSSLASSLAIDFAPCEYSAEVFRARVRDTLFYVADGLDKYALTYCDNAMQLQRINHEAMGAALARLATLVPFLKDPSFAGEKEWRLIFLGTPAEKLTRPTKRYGEALYIKVPLQKPDRMDLHEIITGSRAIPDLARSTLDRCGYGHVGITASRVPYR
jgi:hypothetical protein